MIFPYWNGLLLVENVFYFCLKSRRDPKKMKLCNLDPSAFPFVFYQIYKKRRKREIDEVDENVSYTFFLSMRMRQPRRFTISFVLFFVSLSPRSNTTQVSFRPLSKVSRPAPWGGPDSVCFSTLKKGGKSIGPSFNIRQSNVANILFMYQYWIPIPYYHFSTHSQRGQTSPFLKLLILYCWKGNHILQQ